MSSFARILTLSTVLFMAAPAAAFEKGDAEITPMIGLYAATADNLNEDVPGQGSITARRGNAVAGGARFTYWMRNRLAFELAGIYTSGTLDGQAFGVQGDMTTNNFFGSARLVASPGSGEKVRVLFSGGLVLASQSYESLDGSSFMAGVLGVALHVPLNEKAALRLDLDDYIYNSWWEIDDLRTTTLLQHDVVATVGISFNLGD